MICKQPPDSPYVRGAFPVLRDGGDDDDDDDDDDDNHHSSASDGGGVREHVAEGIREPDFFDEKIVVDVVVVVAKHTWKRRQLEYEQR